MDGTKGKPGESLGMTGEQKREVVEESLEARNPEALFADGLDEALIGVGGQFQECVAVYSVDRIIRIYQERDGMTWDEAWDYFLFNVAEAGVGPNGPIFVEGLEGEE